MGSTFASCWVMGEKIGGDGCGICHGVKMDHHSAGEKYFRFGLAEIQTQWVTFVAEAAGRGRGYVSGIPIIDVSYIEKIGKQRV